MNGQKKVATRSCCHIYTTTHHYARKKKKRENGGEGDANEAPQVKIQRAAVLPEVADRFFGNFYTIVEVKCCSAGTADVMSVGSKRRNTPDSMPFDGDDEPKGTRHVILDLAEATDGTGESADSNLGDPDRTWAFPT